MDSMNREVYMTKAACIIVITGLLVLFSNVSFMDTAEGADLSAAMKNEAQASWRENRLALGKAVYEKTCSACHDDGLDGAPAIGDQQAWSQRSPLWSAVLFEHSKSGYLDMPAKGAHPELSDQEVDAASEYMLSTTFPEMPLD
jgi:cytochrome c5